MILDPLCIGCMFDQVRKAMQMIRPNIPSKKIIETQRKLIKFIYTTDILDNPSPLLGQTTYRLIAEGLGMKDPYKNLKRKSNQLALQYYDTVLDIINKADDPVFEAIAVAAIGNTLDYGAHHQIDLINDIKNFTPKNLAINDIPKFKDAMENTEHLLILGDNAGEIVFDKVLIVTLQNVYLDIEILYTVRSGPIINDALMEDAEAVGLTEIVEVIEAPASPGILLEQASEEFKKHFYKEGGVILSKGQGNFESLYGVEMPNKEVFYLLKAKCELMEKLFSVDLYDLIFQYKNSRF